MSFPSALTKISILLIYLNHVKETNLALIQVNIKLDDKNNSLQSIESEVAGLSVEDRINALENQLNETAKKYDEIGRGLAMVVADLERASESGELGENALKSVQVFGEKANQREEEYKNQIKTLTNRLKEAEARAELAERSVKKLQKEVDRLEEELVNEKEKD